MISTAVSQDWLWNYSRGNLLWIRQLLDTSQRKTSNKVFNLWTVKHFSVVIFLCLKSKLYFVLWYPIFCIWDPFFFCHFFNTLADNHPLIEEPPENLEHPLSQLTLSVSMENQQNTCMRSKYWHLLWRFSSDEESKWKKHIRYWFLCSFLHIL